MTIKNSALWLLIGGLGFAAVQPAKAGIALLTASGLAAVHDQDGLLFDNKTWTESGSKNTVAFLRELHASGAFDVVIETDMLSLSWNGLQSVRRTSQEARSELESQIGGVFWFESDLDVLVSVSGMTDFALNGDEDPVASLVLEVFNENQDRIYQSYAGSGDDPSGVIQLADSILLTAGQQYFVTVESTLRQIAVGFPDLASTASSQVSLTVQSVPEPGTLLLLAGFSLAIAFRNKT